LLAHRLLAEVIVQPFRPYRGLDRGFVAALGRIDDAFLAHAWSLKLRIKRHFALSTRKAPNRGL